MASTKQRSAYDGASMRHTHYIHVFLQALSQRQLPQRSNRARAPTSSAAWGQWRVATPAWRARALMAQPLHASGAAASQAPGARMRAPSGSGVELYWRFMQNISPGQGLGAANQCLHRPALPRGSAARSGGSVAGNCLFRKRVWRGHSRECWEQTVMRAAVRSALCGDTVKCLLTPGVRCLGTRVKLAVRGPRAAHMAGRRMTGRAALACARGAAAMMRV